MLLLDKIMGTTLHSKTIFISLALSLLLVYIWCVKLYLPDQKTEGFTQDGPFIIKRDDAIYDDFYAKICNKLYLPEQNNNLVADIIMRDAPDKKNSILLFIGYSDAIYLLQDKGYNVFAIEKSQDIVDYNIIRHPKLQIKVGDYQKPMTYDSSTFTHITCIGFNIYRVRDKKAFFRNMFNWLIPNGTMIIQLADREKFNTITPAGKSQVLGDNPQKYATERITETEIDFGHLTYNSKYDFSKAQEHNLVTLSESFTDNNSHKVRKNEQTYHFEDIATILKIILNCGFTLKTHMRLQNDEFQYFFTFVR